MLATDLVAEGYPVQLVVLSDQNAEDFVGRTSAPIFEDPSAGTVSWQQTQPGATKHDTFVYARDGVRVLFWDATSKDLATLAADIRVAVESQGK